ncbi:hypothetical protein BDR26DRAFT_916685 [Obelidium mucronatum]|nr:hypothetical protein BDR26DRAFT_916685 [Obelidium mucronatum]
MDYAMDCSVTESFNQQQLKVQSKIDAVSKGISIVQTKLDNPEQLWGALSPFEKGLYKDDASSWWGKKEAALEQEKAALDKEKAALQQEKAALQQEKVLLLQIQLENEKKTSPRGSKSSSEASKPKGPTIEMSPTAILDFLEASATNSSKFHVRPHLLSPSNLSFKLAGREAALKKAAECMQVLSKPASETSRASRKIPVCSGLSGLGKSRMLEEWKQIFDLAGIQQPRLGTLVLYHNGHQPHKVEQSMKIQASFSWRLLHRLFLEGNGPGFADWFEDFLPSNGDELSLRVALKVVVARMVKSGELKVGQTLQMFLGVDEYQSIEEVNGIRVCKVVDRVEVQKELLPELLNVLGDILSDPVDGICIYPMFAGTDFSAISIANSSKTEILRLPMMLLSPAEVETAVSSVTHGPSLLMQSPVRRHLFYLGGVPRWAFEYISLLLEKIQASNHVILSIEEIEESFKTIKNAYVEEWGKKLEDIDLIKLAAYSVSGIPVEKTSKVIAGMKWSRIRDSSLCLLTDNSEVLIPYAIFHRIGRLIPNNYFNAERCFIECVQGLIEKVDSLIYDKAAWALWEVFGAYFHSLRINAMLIVASPVVKLSTLFKGALVSGCDVEVELSPMTVMEYDDKFGSTIGNEIGRKGNSSEKHDWLKDGLVVINGENGKGVDLFFGLKKRGKNEYVICLDQRKRVAGGNLGVGRIQTLLSSATIPPTALGPVMVVPLLFSSLVSTNVDELGSRSAVVVTYAQLQQYHGGLWLHPAASPCVNVNKDPISYIKMLLTGDGQDIQKVANVLVTRKRGFKSIESFADAVQKISKHVKIENEEQIVFC